MDSKRLISFKRCIFKTPTQCFEQIFSSEFSFSDIERCMISAFSIDKESISEIHMSSVTLYTTKK